MIDKKETIKSYIEALERERGMRKEVQNIVYEDPVLAMNSGLIKLSFAFPTPNHHYRRDVMERLQKTLGLKRS